MKLRFFSLVCAIASTLALSAESAVEWASTIHNFGAFDEDNGKVECTFTFTNTGDEPVAIVNARANCGCTTPNYSTEPVEPGQSGSITVGYDPSGRPGRFEKYISITFSGIRQSTKLRIHGSVIGSAATIAQRYPIACGPVQLSKGTLLAGEVKKNEMRTVFLSGYNRSSEPVKPSATRLPNFITMTCEPPEVPAGEQFSLVFFYDGVKCPLYGNVTDSITISPVEGSECTIPVLAIVNEDFSRLTPGEIAKAPVLRLSTQSLDFGRVSRNDNPITLTATVRNDGKRALEIRRIYTADPGVTVSIDSKKIKPKKTAVVTVTVDPAALPGAMLNARISVISNDPSAPVQTLRAVGEINN